MERRRRRSTVQVTRTSFHRAEPAAQKSARRASSLPRPAIRFARPHTPAPAASRRSSGRSASAPAAPAAFPRRSAAGPARAAPRLRLASPHRPARRPRPRGRREDPRRDQTRDQHKQRRVSRSQSAQHRAHGVLASRWDRSAYARGQPLRASRQLLGHPARATVKRQLHCSVSVMGTLCSAQGSAAAIARPVTAARSTNLTAHPVRRSAHD